MNNALLSDINELPDPDPNYWIDLPRMLARFETEILQHALNMAEGNQALAAKYCKLNRSTFIEKIVRYKIRCSVEPSKNECAAYRHRMAIYAKALHDRAARIERLVQDLDDAQATKTQTAKEIIA
jgi:DNA-binding protein Fis